MSSFRLCRSSVQTGDEVEVDSLSRLTLSPKLNMFNSVEIVESLNMFNSVEIVESGWFLSPECRTSFRHSVDVVEFNEIDRIEFDFVAIVYRPRQRTWREVSRQVQWMDADFCRIFLARFAYIEWNMKWSAYTGSAIRLLASLLRRAHCNKAEKSQSPRKQWT